MLKSESKLKNFALCAVVAALALVVAEPSFAGTQGNEFESLYTWLNDITTGYLGKSISIAAIVVGAILAVARANPMLILAGIGFAVFLQYTPSIVAGILTATI